MKRIDPEYGPTPNAEWLDWNDVFVLGPDGKRHPTREELVIGATQLGAKCPKSAKAVVEFMRRLATVAPEDTP